MKYGQKLKLGDAHVIPRNIQEVQASKLRDAPRHPFFIGKNHVIFQDTIFLWDFYFRALGSLVVLSFPQPLSFS
jgi:hypothetical protein